MKTSFIEQNETHKKQYGHMMEGIKHRTNDERLNILEQNKLGILIDNAVKQFCASHKMPGDSLDTIREAVNVSGDAVTFVKTQLPLIRKVFANSIIRDMVSIQPMSQPTMKVHYYDIQRDDATSLADDVHTRRTYADNEEYDEGSPTAIKQIQLVITGSTLSATEKKLKADWTVESEQDIYAYHGINIESDLSNALGAEIVREWDRTVIQDMLTQATGGAATFDQTIPAGISYTDKKVWMEGIFEAMVDVDTQIFKKRYRKTNWAITSPEIAAFIEKMAGFVADPVSVDQKVIATGGRYFTGTLNNRWRIYVDPFFPEQKVLMGYNGGGDWLDTCYVWAPYILSYFSDVFQNPQTFVKSRAVLSRAGRMTVVPNLLGVVTVSGS